MRPYRELVSALTDSDTTFQRRWCNGAYKHAAASAVHYGPWHGATLIVSDVRGVISALRKCGAPFISSTLVDLPVAAGGEAIVVRDPDGLTTHDCPLRGTQ